MPEKTCEELAADLARLSDEVASWNSLIAGANSNIANYAAAMYSAPNPDPGVPNPMTWTGAVNRKAQLVALMTANPPPSMSQMMLYQAWAMQYQNIIQQYENRALYISARDEAQAEWVDVNSQYIEQNCE